MADLLPCGLCRMGGDGVDETDGWMDGSIESATCDRVTETNQLGQAHTHIPTHQPPPLPLRHPSQHRFHRPPRQRMAHHRSTSVRIWRIVVVDWEEEAAVRRVLPRAEGEQWCLRFLLGWGDVDVLAACGAVVVR